MADAAQAAARFTAAAGEAFIAAALRAGGLPPEDAAAVAALMTLADLRGADGHGIFRLPQYVRRIRNGGINARPRMHLAAEAEATALLDGDNGMGHLVMRRATEIAIEKARHCGVAWVGTRMSNHAGPASLYAMMPLAYDMVGLYLAVANANHMAPWGGVDLLLGTNPIAVAIPSHAEPPIVLDMATTVVSYGTVKVATLNKEPLGPGWMTDRTGAPLTDSARSGEGLLLPIGGYKGFGLALVFGLLAGTLNGAAMGGAVIDFNADERSVTNTGQAIMALDPARFGAVDAFKRNVDALAREIRGSARMQGVDEIRLPGRHSAEVEAERRQSGIPLRPHVLASLNRLAGDLAIAPLALA